MLCTNPRITTFCNQKLLVIFMRCSNGERSGRSILCTPALWDICPQESSWGDTTRAANTSITLLPSHCLVVLCAPCAARAQVTTTWSHVPGGVLPQQVWGVLPDLENMFWLDNELLALTICVTWRKDQGPSGGVSTPSNTGKLSSLHRRSVFSSCSFQLDPAAWDALQGLPSPDLGRSQKRPS